MIQISTGNRLTGFGEPVFYFNSLDEFAANFPLAEHQCLIQIERELNRNGHYIFSDADCPVDFKLIVLTQTDDASEASP